MTITFSRDFGFGRRLLAAAAVLSVLVTGLVFSPSVTSADAAEQVATAPQAAPAAALAGSAFNPGYIISDYLFYNSNAMSTVQIQAFLDARCPTNNCIDVVKTTTNDRAATNMCPGAYDGQTGETTAALIYKVQRSCGISAKVILVTLQKEQGLLTLQNPTALKLRKAMGMGCPDTSVCDAKYYGLFNQIYYAASQLKRYGLRTSDNISFRNKYQIGVTTAIALNPKSTCGAKNVIVRNKATTALYYYTPYTPNPAALNNLSGTGDTCSSYGNRNFWVYYNNWFGSTLLGQGQETINGQYTADGAQLGAEGASTCTTTSVACRQTYANGTIYWSRANGAWTVLNEFDDIYLAAGGPGGSLGYPSSGLIAIPNSPNGAGTGQVFANGTIYASSAGAFPVYGSIRAAYAKVGTHSGRAGWPTGPNTCANSVCSQQFQNTTIFTSGTKWTREVEGVAYSAAFAASGGRAGVLNYPTGTVVQVPNSPNGAGSGQTFLGGTLYGSAAGVFPTSGAVRAEYWRLRGNAGKLGWPTAAPVCVSGLCSQVFQGGTVSQVSAKVTRTTLASYAPVASTYAAQLGAATGSYVDVLSNKNGVGGGQSYATGSIYSSAAGVFPIWGAVRAEYWKRGSNAGALGWPTGNPSCVASGVCTQTFQKGTITK